MYSTALVRRMVLHFAELAGWEGDRYILTMSRRSFDRAARRYLEPGADANNEWGATLRRMSADPDPVPVTWISPDIKTFALLANTCAHEALHAARPLMPHGPAYERSVRRLLRGEEP